MNIVRITFWLGRSYTVVPRCLVCFVSSTIDIIIKGSSDGSNSGKPNSTLLTALVLEAHKTQTYPLSFFSTVQAKRFVEVLKIFY